MKTKTDFLMLPLIDHQQFKNISQYTVARISPSKAQNIIKKYRECGGISTFKRQGEQLHCMPLTCERCSALNNRVTALLQSRPVHC